MEQFLLSVLASLVAVSMVLLFERQRRPELEFEIEPVAPVQPNGRKFLRVRVRNRALPGFLGPVYDRQPALMTRAGITFLTLDGHPVFTPGRRMRGRWSDTPEPFRPTPVGPDQMVLVAEPFAASNSMDIPPGEFEVLDVVMRAPGSEQCVGWSNAYQLAQAGAPPPVGDTFVLDRGRYLVLIQAKTGGRIFPHVLRLVNDVPLPDFRLEEPEQQPRLPPSALGK